MWKLHSWKTSQRLFSCRKFKKGQGTSSVSAFRYMWPNINTFYWYVKVFNYLYCDFRRRTWVFFWKEKSKEFSFFKHFKAIVENHSGCFLTVLHTKRGGEFTSHEFRYFCKENGMKRKLTASYTCQNRVAERKNSTIVEMAWGMINLRAFQTLFWKRL
jgi:transposase InsO family protein